MYLIFGVHCVYMRYIYSAIQMDKTYLTEKVMIRIEMKFEMKN